ncbi:MAG: hypothetical protein LBL74_07405 [Bacteroidales bacterium]|nr:hypothetical protein [Bacteroidales bacterium]
MKGCFVRTEGCFRKMKGCFVTAKRRNIFVALTNACTIRTLMEMFFGILRMD